MLPRTISSAHLTTAGAAYRIPTVDRPAPARGVVLGPDALRAPASGPATGAYPLRSTSQILCAEGASCTCPLSDQVTDAERALMNDIARQAARLKAVFCWVFALVALVAAVALLLD